MTDYSQGETNDGCRKGPGSRKPTYLTVLSEEQQLHIEGESERIEEPGWANGQDVAWGNVMPIGLSYIQTL